MKAPETDNIAQIIKPELYRFRLMLGHRTSEGKFEKTKTLGMAYLVNGSRTYTLRLWTLLEDKYYLVPKKHDPAQFLLFTRERTKDSSMRSQSFSNIVGNGKADPQTGVIKIEFDLLDKPIYMSIYPEPFTRSTRIQSREAMNEAA